MPCCGNMLTDSNNTAHNNSTACRYVPAREWMRICFELLELLKAHKKAIRRATVNTFGYIAKAIGPQDVLVTLLNNLKVSNCP